MTARWAVRAANSLFLREKSKRQKQKKDRCCGPSFFWFLRSAYQHHNNGKGNENPGRDLGGQGHLGFKSRIFALAEETVVAAGQGSHTVGFTALQQYGNDQHQRGEDQANVQNNLQRIHA